MNVISFFIYLLKMAIISWMSHHYNIYESKTHIDIIWRYLNTVIPYNLITILHTNAILHNEILSKFSYGFWFPFFFLFLFRNFTVMMICVAMVCGMLFLTSYKDGWRSDRVVCFCDQRPTQMCWMGIDFSASDGWLGHDNNVLWLMLKNPRENRRGNKELTIQRHRQHWTQTQKHSLRKTNKAKTTIIPEF